MAVPLDVDGQVSVVADDGAEISLQANGSVIRIQMPSLWASHRLLRTGAVAADLQVQFTVAGRLVAQLDTQSQGSVLARLLGLGPIKLHPVTMFMSLFKKGE